MKKILSMALACAMLATVLTGCGGGASSSASAPAASAPAASAPAASAPAAAEGAFKIGGHGPLTGGAAIYGIAVKNAAYLAVEEINAMGGIQFEVQYEDDEHDAEKAVNAYNALKDWGMQISMSGVTSKPAEATGPMHEEDGIFGITPSGSSTAVPSSSSTVFQMCFTDPNQGSASARYIAEQKLGTKIAVIYKNDDVYSQGIYDTFVKGAAENGLEIVSTTTFTDATANDFTVQLNDAKSGGADLVFLPMYYTPASLILKQASDMGYAPAFFGVDGMDGILTVENFDTKLAEGVMLLTPFSADATDDKTVNFVTKYQEKYGEIPNQFAADAYDCVYAIKQALEESGCTPDMSADEIGAKLVETFCSMTFDGITGAGVTWDASGEVTKSPKGMVIENGAYVGM